MEMAIGERGRLPQRHLLVLDCVVTPQPDEAKGEEVTGAGGSVYFTTVASKGCVRHRRDVFVRHLLLAPSEPEREDSRSPCSQKEKPTMNRRILLIALLSIVGPQTAQAEYVDVITNKMSDDCTMEQYLASVEEFRGVMTSQGYTYTVEILAPVTSPDLTNVFWVGRTKDLATFGAEYTKWLTALENAGSPEAKVNAKLNKCSTNVSRSGALTQ